MRASHSKAGALQPFLVSHFFPFNLPYIAIGPTGLVPIAKWDILIYMSIALIVQQYVGNRLFVLEPLVRSDKVSRVLIVSDEVL